MALKDLTKKILFGYQPENIADEKQQIGFDTGAKNVAISAKTKSFFKSLLLEIFGRNNDTEPVFLISFESNCIVFIGVNNLTSRYNGDNYIVNPKDITMLELKEGSWNDYLKIKSTDISGNFRISTRDTKYPYHQDTVQHLSQLVDRYMAFISKNN